MKKLLLSFLFLAFVFMAQAQDAKPTKEATQKFLNNMLSQVVGAPQRKGDIIVIQKQYFNSDFTKFTCQKGIEDSYNIDEDKNIKWAEFTEFQEFSEGIVTLIRTNFRSKIEETNRDAFGKWKTLYTNSIDIYVPTEKAESCKKAFFRLAEIAKEENKDPFTN